MATHVVEAAQLIVASSKHQDAFSCHAYVQVLALSWDLIRATNAEPLPEENALGFESKDIRARVEA